MDDGTCNDGERLSKRLLHAALLNLGVFRNEILLSVLDAVAARIPFPTVATGETIHRLHEYATDIGGWQYFHRGRLFIFA